ncbi:TonB-dependent receptor [Sphingomicrobium sp. XHP0235]|uniref:TonB-dependent receptor n=1 Tax=Sphingomicrobium aquimarinum TaxID=3133971 RepID=UPI0031FEEE35
MKLPLNTRFVATASTIAMALAASPALAQTVDESDTTPEQEQEAEQPNSAIVITGFRQALENSIDMKRDSPVIAEAFSAEDIGKLPDVSIAETLGRLPGLAVQRIDGRAQSLSVRGLGPDYSTSLLNGRELVSSGDNRAVEYDQYPAELINNGIVYKIPYAGLIGQGLAGTVDLRTIRPLDAIDTVVSVSGRIEWNEEGSLNPDIEAWGYRATATYVDQFADDTVGLAVGAALQSSPSQVKRFNAWGYPGIGEGDAAGPNYPDDSAGELILGGMKPFARSVDLDRLGLFGTLEYDAGNNWNTALDVFFADYKENIPQRGIEFPLNPGWGGARAVSEVVSGPGTIAQGATFTGVQPVIRNDYDRKDTQTFAAGWNVAYDGEDVLLNLDASYSNSDRRLEQIESYSGFGYGAPDGAVQDTVSYQLSDDGFPFIFSNTANYADTSTIFITDPRGWGGGRGLVQAGFINDTRTKDDLTTLRAEAGYKLPGTFLEKFVAGVAWSDRNKSRDILQNFLSIGGASPYLDQGAIRQVAIPTEALLEPTDSLGFLGLGNQVIYDPFALLDSGFYTLTDIQSSDLPYPGDWTVNEQVWTLHARADIDTMLGSVPLTGNFGLQYVLTDQESSGFNSPGGIGAVATPVTDGDEYSHLLPSVSLNFELSEDSKLRFGAARTLARPRMDQLNASSNASVSELPQGPLTSIFGGGGGNPQLRPYIADSVDASYEYYFGGGEGYFAAATYYKWLDDFVNPNASVVRDFAYLLPVLSPEQLAIANSTTTLGLVSGPDNGASGHIFGVEASVAVPFGLMAPALEGFGFQTSVSYTESELTIDGTEDTIDVPGLSDWVVNSTAFFERGGFEARVSHRYRTEFLAEFIGISASRTFRTTKAESIFDAQIGYRFGEGTAVEGLSLTFQALNITDEPFISYQNGDELQVIDYESYGRTYLLGASYRF